jgi:hypothetical protein
MEKKIFGGLQSDCWKSEAVKESGVVGDCEMVLYYMEWNRHVKYML